MYTHIYEHFCIRLEADIVLDGDRATFRPVDLVPFALKAVSDPPTRLGLWVELADILLQYPELHPKARKAREVGLFVSCNLVRCCTGCVLAQRLVAQSAGVKDSFTPEKLWELGVEQ